MEAILLDEVIRTLYGQIRLDWMEDDGFEMSLDTVFRGQANGLVGAADPNGVYLNLAYEYGARVRLVLHDVEPPLPPARFKDVVEVSVTIPIGVGVAWVTWADETSGDIPDWPPGSYRLRVSAVDRDAAHLGKLPEGVDDEYLLEAWPAPPTPDDIIRVGTADAAYMHALHGGQR